MDKKLNLLVTGGAGFIGSHFINFWRKNADGKILVVDNFSQTKVAENPTEARTLTSRLRTDFTPR